jgi:hypothetical protein
VLEEARAVARKEACTLRARLQELERARGDACRELQERRRQVRGPHTQLSCTPSHLSLFLPHGHTGCKLLLLSFWGLMLARATLPVRARTDSEQLLHPSLSVQCPRPERRCQVGVCTGAEVGPRAWSHEGKQDLCPDLDLI